MLACIYFTSLLIHIHYTHYTSTYTYTIMYRYSHIHVYMCLEKTSFCALAAHQQVDGQAETDARIDRQPANPTD